MRFWRFALALCVGLVAALATLVGAHSSYVGRIPNGSVSRCSNCHVDPAGGGTRTSFGQDFKDNSPSDRWSAALAAKDSDGDGWSNGAELQDPNGTWSAGQLDPGNAAWVSNPGQSQSVPPVATEPSTWSAIKSLYRHG